MTIMSEEQVTRPTKDPTLTHTFMRTGETCTIIQVSPFVVEELRRSFPPPPIPTQTVDYGNGKTVVEDNPDHPQYRADMEAYGSMLEEKFRIVLFSLGVEMGYDKEWVTKFRGIMKKAGADARLPDDDKVVYITYRCLEPNEYEQMCNKILGISQPTREAVEKHIQSFPSDIPAQGLNGSESAAGKNKVLEIP